MTAQLQSYVVYCHCRIVLYYSYS